MARFCYTWRNKFLAINTESFDEFISVLENAVNTLKEWQSMGIIFTGNGVGDDYAEFMTHDPELANKLGFIDEKQFDDEFEIEEEE